MNVKHGWIGSYSEHSNNSMAYRSHISNSVVTTIDFTLSIFANRSICMYNAYIGN
jgi:hypothetical protein